jgi:5-methylcytosine-specific restriction protein A
MAMLKLCGCGKRISMDLSRCDSCKDKYKERHKMYDHSRRDKVSATFYHDKLWTLKQAEIKRRDYGLCLLCKSKKRFKPMKLVHHIVELKEDRSLGLEDSNLISLCSVCHGYVHKQYETNKKEMQLLLRDLAGGTSETFYS